MTLDRWDEVKRLFHRALELTVAERPAFLAAECRDDAALEEELSILLAAHEGAPAFLEGGVLAVAPELTSDLAAAVKDLRIGPYRVLSELGRGGMGTVYLAVRDDDTYAQEVAIKLVKRGMDTAEILSRFLSERQILATLIHPHIARLLDGGSTADGRPYFVMEAIAGRPITAFCDEHQLAVEERLRLFLEVAGAVSFAHQNLVVHRDLKPANVLVGEDGVPKLLDFGIAKLLAPTASALTLADSRPRSPDFASPEQVAGGSITTATDVHGLGLLLYLLLTGVNPLLDERGMDLAGEVRPPSELARLRGARQLSHRLEGDLDAIVQKALRREPTARYASVRDMVEDLEHHLSHRPVKARRPTFLYRAGRMVQRHRLASASAATVLVLSIAALVQSAAAVRARHREERQRQRAEAALALLVDGLRVSDPEQARGQDISVRQLLDATAERLLANEQTSTDLTSDPETRAGLLRVIGEIQLNLGHSEAALSVLRPALALGEFDSGRDAALDRARTAILLARALRDRGAFAESRRLLDEALAARERELEPEDPLLAEVWDERGELAFAVGEVEAAEGAFVRAVAIARQSEGRAAALAESLANLATVYLDTGRAAAAAPLLEEVLALAQELDGPRSPRAAADSILLGSALYRAGNFEPAVLRLREGLALRREIYGSGHPLVGSALLNLSAAERAAGRLTDAAATVAAAVALYRGLHPDPHVNLADALTNQGDLERLLGHPEAARCAFEEALVIYGRLPEPRPVPRANVLNHLAQLASERGEHRLASDLVDRALTLAQTNGGESAEVAAFVNSRATVLAKAGRITEAEVAFGRALAERRRLLPANHPDIATSLVGLGDLLLQAGRADEAEPLVREGFEIRHAKLGPDHPRTAAAAGLLERCRAALPVRSAAR